MHHNPHQNQVVSKTSNESHISQTIVQYEDTSEAFQQSPLVSFPTHFSHLNLCKPNYFLCHGHSRKSITFFVRTHLESYSTKIKPEPNKLIIMKLRKNNDDI